jgi:hypothetical protein
LIFISAAFCIQSNSHGHTTAQKVLLVKKLTSQDGHQVSFFCSYDKKSLTHFYLQTTQKVVHDGFKIDNLENNIAALKFDHNLLEFGARPICLWNQDLHINADGITQNNGVGTVNNFLNKENCLSIAYIIADHWRCSG